MKKLFVGIDIAKTKFDACIKNEMNHIMMKARQYNSLKDDMDRLISDILDLAENRSDVLIGMEASGKYHKNLMHYLIRKGFDVREFNPLEVAAFRKQRIRKTKTDKIDAEVITDVLRWDMNTNTERYLNDEAYEKMKEMSAVRNRIVQRISQLKIDLRLDLSTLCSGYDSIFPNNMCKTSIEILNKSIKVTKLFDITEEKILSIVESNYQEKYDPKSIAKKVKRSFDKSTCPEHLKDPVVYDIKNILGQFEILIKQKKQMDKRIERLVKESNPVSMSIPGLGSITCATILGCLGNVKRFRNDRAIIAYAGLDPIIYQSGTSINKSGRISRRGNKYLRTALITASMIGIMKNPVLKKRYNDLKSRGKHHYICLIACARKLLQIIYSLEKNGKRFYIPSNLKIE